VDGSDRWLRGVENITSTTTQSTATATTARGALRT
jgi:hypothetical protein